VTSIGSDNLLMAYTHVAHDVRIGDHVIIGNSVGLAGHVIIEDWVDVSLTAACTNSAALAGSLHRAVQRSEAGRAAVFADQP